MVGAVGMCNMGMNLQWLFLTSVHPGLERRDAHRLSGDGVPWHLGDGERDGTGEAGSLGGEEGGQGWGRTNWSLQNPESQREKVQHPRAEATGCPEGVRDRDEGDCRKGALEVTFPRRRQTC